MIYLQLFYEFFLIGSCCFGGAYAVIPFIQDAVVSNGWMTNAEFLNMIAVSESTPGPIAVNTATYVGFKLAGYSGGAVATLGLISPVFIIVFILSAFLKTERGQKLLKRLMIGIKPVVVGMIFYAAWIFIREIFANGAPADYHFFLNAFIMLASFIAIHKFKVNPILLICIAAVVGITVY